MRDDFLDSNILIYALDGREPAKRAITRALVQDALSDGATISYQVVQETLNVLSRAEFPATEADISQFFELVLLPLWRVMPSEGLFREALRLKARFSVSLYDALILSAALTAGCTRLFSEDLQAGQRIGDLVVVNPFAAP